MIQHKFRFWNIKNREMISWDQARSEELVGLDMWFSEHFVAMQFTGLTDCKGVEIYSGDVVKVTNISVFDDVDYILVQWREKTASFNLHNIVSLPNSQLEVIGNIWQNPKLLDAY